MSQSDQNLCRRRTAKNSPYVHLLPGRKPAPRFRLVRLLRLLPGRLMLPDPAGQQPVPDQGGGPADSHGDQKGGVGQHLQQGQREAQQNQDAGSRQEPNLSARISRFSCPIS